MYRVGLWRIDHAGALDGVQKGSRLPGYQNRVGPRVSGAGINSRFVTGGIPTASAFGSSSVLVVIITQVPPGSPSRRGRGTVYIDDPSDMGIFIVELGGSSLQESVRGIAGIPSNSPPPWQWPMWGRCQIGWQSSWAYPLCGTEQRTSSWSFPD